MSNRFITIPDPRAVPTMSVEDAGRIFFGFSRSKSYAEAARWLATDGREGLPTLRFGRSLRAVTSQCARLAGLDGG